MRPVTTALVIAMLLVSPVVVTASQQPVAAAAEARAFATMAAAIPVGSRVRVQTASGKRMRATLMTVTSDAVIVKRDSRLPEPAVTIPFTDLAQLYLDKGNGGMSLGKAIGIGVAAGVGAILTMFAIALQLD